MEEHRYKNTTFWAERKENTFLTNLPFRALRQKTNMPACTCLLIKHAHAENFAL